MGRVALAIFLLAVPLGFGLATLALGMDANWDLRNYHYYNAYAWLTGREGYDILAAQAQTFFNPLIDVPFYLATQAWPARLVGFLLGTLQGLNVLPLYGIAYEALDIAERSLRSIWDHLTRFCDDQRAQIPFLVRAQDGRRLNPVWYRVEPCRQCEDIPLRHM